MIEPKEAFVLFNLGTSTNYTLDNHIQMEIGRKKYPIPSTETLSYFSHCVSGGAPVSDSSAMAAATEIASQTANGSLPTCITQSANDLNKPIVRRINPNSVIIDGPDVAGNRVYDRMARGVYVLLNAIKAGHTTLNLVGHSRGAVQSILEAHELAQMQKALLSSEERSLTAAELKTMLIGEVSDKNTQQSLKEFLDDFVLQDENVASFCGTFKQVRLNIFAIDPVPGGEPGLLDWKDDRYFSIPPIVKHYEQILLLNERSIGFRGLIPNAANPQQTEVNIIPLYGHHGSASGNPTDQQYSLHKAKLEKLTQDNPSVSPLSDAMQAIFKETRSSQHQTVYKLHDFLSKNHTRLCVPSKTNNWKTLYLDSIYDAYHSLSSVEKLKCRHEAYQDMLQNKTAYDAFNDRSFPSGRENLVAWWAGYDPVGSRWVYKDAKKERVAAEALFPFLNDKTFVNDEHAILSAIVTHLQSVQNDPEQSQATDDGDLWDMAVGYLDKALSCEETVEGQLKNKIEGLVTPLIDNLLETIAREELTDKNKARVVTLVNKISPIKGATTHVIVKPIVDLLKIFFDKKNLAQNLMWEQCLVSISKQDDPDLDRVQVINRASQSLTAAYERLSWIYEQFKSVISIDEDHSDIRTDILLLETIKNNAESLNQAALCVVRQYRELEERLDMLAEDHAMRMQMLRQKEEYGQNLAELDTKFREIKVQVVTGLEQKEQMQMLQEEHSQLIQLINVQRRIVAEHQAALAQLNTAHQNTLQQIQQTFGVDPNAHWLSGLSMQVISGFIGALGFSAVVAVTVLCVIGCSPVVPVLGAVLGAGMAMAVGGFFGSHHGAQRAYCEQLYDVLSPRALA